MKTSNRLCSRRLGSAPLRSGTVCLLAVAIVAVLFLLCGCSEDIKGPDNTAAAAQLDRSAVSNFSDVRFIAQANEESSPSSPMPSLVTPNVIGPGSNTMSSRTNSSAQRPKPPGALAFVIPPGLPAGSNRAIGSWQRFVSVPGSIKVLLGGGAVAQEWRLEGEAVQGMLETGPGFPIQPGQTALPGLVNARVNAFIPLASLQQVPIDGQTSATSVPQDLLETEVGGITLSIGSLELKGLPRRAEEPYLFEARGEIALGGVTNAVTLPLFVTPLGSDRLRLKGETTFPFGGTANPLGAKGLLRGKELKLSFDWTVQDREAVF